MGNNTGAVRRAYTDFLIDSGMIVVERVTREGSAISPHIKYE